MGRTKCHGTAENLAKPHGKTLWRRYCHMKNRCLNPNYHAFHRYGGRGISICPEWVSSFPEFYSWALSSGFRPDLELDRRDNNGNYTPENCRWVTRLENILNREITPRYSESGRRAMRACLEDPEIRRRCFEAFRAKCCKPIRRDDGVTYPSITEASRSTGLSIAAISKAATGVHKSSGGYRWEYA